jgi:imidazolonepropionase
MKLLLINIQELVQVEEEPRHLVCGDEMKHIETIKNAFLLIKDELIIDFGPMENLNQSDLDNYDLLMEIDCKGKLVFPSFCDSHTHLIYPASREEEFVEMLKGVSYYEITRKGGGILSSSKLLHKMSEKELYDKSLERVIEIAEKGTGAVEIKSGYGLNVKDELKMLRVIRKLKETTPLAIKSTLLGAHAVPEEYRQTPKDYINLIIEKLIPQVAGDELAEFIDVFCDDGFFSQYDTEKILEAGLKHGLKPKIHANKLGFSGGVQAGVKYNALSVDHVEFISEEEIELLKDSTTIPTILPGSTFFMKTHFSPARKMIDSGLPLAIASDYNPGSSPSGDMKFMQSLGCINYGLLPEEVINATTINSAYAMGISDSYGSIAIGKAANVFITKDIPSYAYLPYAYSSNLIDTVILRGEIQ